MISPSKKKTLQTRRRAKKYSDVYAGIAKSVKEARAKLGLTQAEFANLLKVSEISVRRWELALGHEPNFRARQKIKEIIDGNS
jgi:DNA-binding transcriptional regulator YiaG